MLKIAIAALIIAVIVGVGEKVIAFSDKEYPLVVSRTLKVLTAVACVVAIVSSIVYAKDIFTTPKTGEAETVEDITGVEVVQAEEPDEIEPLPDFGPGGLDKLAMASVFDDPESARFVENKLDLASTPILNDARTEASGFSDAVGFPLWFDESTVTSKTAAADIRKAVEEAKSSYTALSDEEKIDLLNKELLNRRFQNPAQLIQEMQGLLKYEAVLVKNEYWLDEALTKLKGYYADELKEDELKGYEKLVEYDGSGEEGFEHLRLTAEYREWAGRVTFLIDALIDQGIYQNPQSSWNYKLEPATSMREIWPEEADYQENKPAILKSYVQKNGKQSILVGWNLLDGRFEGFEKKPILRQTPKEEPKPTPKSTPKPTPKPTPDPDPDPDPELPPPPSSQPKKDPSKDPVNQGNANTGGGNKNADGDSDEYRPAPKKEDYTPPSPAPKQDDPKKDDGGGAHNGTYDQPKDNAGGTTHDNDSGNVTRNESDKASQTTTGGGGSVNVSNETVDGSVDIPND